MQPSNDIWKLTLEALSREFSSTSFSIWFSELSLNKLDDKEAVVVCANDFKRDIIISKYTEAIAKALESVIGFPVEVRVVSPRDAEIIPVAPTEDEPESEDDDEGEPNYFSTGGTVKVTNYAAGGYNEDYTFDTFIVGNSNKFAQAACLAVATSPAKEYNPLFIYGSSGLGKTHLLYAITHEVNRRYPNMNIVYVKGEEFTNQLVESISRNKTTEFRNKYRKVDVLLIDDIQFIAGKDSTQEEFFHTFNALYEDHKQIIMTSDRPPRDIKTLEDRLKTRFEWGLIADVQPPDFELRIAIMKNKAALLGLNVPIEVLTFLADNLKSNVRQLEGAIKRIGAQSFLSGVPVTNELALSCVSDLLTDSEPVNVTVDKILEKVSKKCSVPVEDIKSSKRNKNIAAARHLSIYLMRKLTDMSFPAIGKVFARDHTTILASVKCTENEMKANPTFEHEINELIKEIKG